MAYYTTAAPLSKFNDFFIALSVLESISYAVGNCASILLRGELALILRCAAREERAEYRLRPC
jgi:hypothetical protein